MYSVRAGKNLIVRRARVWRGAKNIIYSGFVIPCGGGSFSFC